MPDTPSTRFGIPRYLGGDVAQFAPQVNAVVDSIDGQMLGWLTDDAMDRPGAAGEAGRVFAATEGQLYYDTGSEWIELTPPLRFSHAWNPGPLTNGTAFTASFACAGAVTGDPVLVGYTDGTTAGVILSAQCATNSVLVTLVNHSGGTVDLNGTLKIRVFK